MTEQEFWGRSAAEMVGRGEAPPAVELPGTQAEVDAILAKGRRKIEAPDLLREHGDHARAVRAAFVDGVQVGAQGFADEEDASRFWRYSDTRRKLLADVPGRNVLGTIVICSDPAAAGRTPWKVVGIYGEAVWLVAKDGEHVTVPAGSCRSITGGMLFDAW